MPRSSISKPNNTTLIVIVAIVAIAILAGVYMNKGGQKTVNASGSATISVMPDEAIVYLLVETRNISAQGAKDENALITENVLDALAAIGVSKSDIQTENYNIYPEYSYVGGTQVLKGYIASNYIKVTSKNFDNVGQIVDASVNAGSLVNYINFDLSDAKMSEYKAMALANASADAKKKAEAVVSGLGKKLGNLVSVSAPEYGYMPYPLYRMESAGAVDVKQVATNIQPKQVEVSATVNVVYEIK